MFYNRFIPNLTALITLFGMEFFLYWPDSIYWNFSLITLIYLFACIQISRITFQDKRWWIYLILPIGLTLSVCSFLTLLDTDNKIIFHSLILIDTIFIFWYFKALYIYLTHNLNESSLNMENLSIYGNFLAVFFGSSALFGFYLFLTLAIEILILSLGIFIALLTYQLVTVLSSLHHAQEKNEIDIKKFIFFYTLISLEIAVCIVFLPFSYLILALIFTLFYYNLIGLSKRYILGSFNNKSIKLYLILSLISILLIIATTRWL